MRTLILALAGLAGAVALPSTGLAQQQLFLNQNQTGLNLPGVTLPGGHDEVRAADGTTCRSAVSGNGAYVDMGVIGNGNNGDNNTAGAAYGRVVIPLGAPKGRVDCRQLYNLELERLKAEIRLLRQGGGKVVQTSAQDGNWSKEGWE